jgi:3-dehydroquinate dehydratase/shikimate dehydrogenase
VTSAVRPPTLVATLTAAPDEATLRALAPQVGILEVRADLVGDLDPGYLRSIWPGQLLYTVRSRAEGGAFEGGRQARRRRLAAAAPHYDLVDLEAERDIQPDLLAEVPAAQRLISWHGPSAPFHELQSRFASLAATEARYYKMIPHAAQSGDELRGLQLLQSLGRDDLACFAMGEIGAWTRVVAPRFGSPLVYGAIGRPGAPGQLSIEQLIRDYSLPALPKASAYYGIVGKPVAHSLSPRLHNGAYRALGIDALYLPFHADSFGDFWLEVVESGAMAELGLPLRGLSVTAPYKEVALAVSGASSPRAQQIEAANTLVCCHEEVWEAETTDPEGVVLALDRNGVALRGRKAAVVGCGGAGKAAAFGLHLAGAEVVLVNRSTERGKKASAELGMPFVPYHSFEPSRFDIVVQATSLGHHPDDELPFDPERLRADATVLDMVYGSEPTRLVQRTRDLGRRAIDGREILLYQALGQFRLMTGHRLDETLARELLGMPARAPS